MNSELVRQASERVPTPHILVNMVSQRIRALSQGSRPLIEVPSTETSSLEIALREIVEERITWVPVYPDDEEEESV